MTPISPPDLLAVAKYVYEDNHWEVHCGSVIHGDIIMGQWKKLGDFNPKLDGTDREQAQALRCIVAAFKMASVMQMQSYLSYNEKDYIFSAEFRLLGEQPGCWPFHKIPDSNDILTCALLAILKHIGTNNEQK